MSNDHPGQDEPLLTAAKMLAWRRGRSPEPPARLPEAAVLTHQGVLLPARRPWRRNRLTGGFSFEAQALSGGAVTLAAVRGVGAPGTAIAIEELAAAGVRRLIAVDIGGSIESDVHTGDLVVVEAALACDGTSPHYAPERVLEGHKDLSRRLAEGLTAAGVPFTAGRAWSTDAVYRETPSQLVAVRKEGALLADMETGCVFAVSKALGLQAAAVLVAADEMHDGWRPPDDMSLVNHRLRDALGVAITCLLQ